MKKWLISSLLGLVLILAACGEGENDPVNNDLDPGGVEDNIDHELDDGVNEDMDSEVE